MLSLESKRLQDRKSPGFFLVFWPIWRILMTAILLLFSKSASSFKFLGSVPSVLIIVTIIIIIWDNTSAFKLFLLDSNICLIESLMLNDNPWNHSTANKLLILKRVITYEIVLLEIISLWGDRLIVFGTYWWNHWTVCKQISNIK